MKKRIVSSALAALSLFAFAASAASPGTDSDPLISKSYIDEVVYPYIDDAVASSSAMPTQIVNLSEGEYLYCSMGTELILRSGTADVVATAKGGICDATWGYDLADGAQVPPNHLLIVPYDDGRGVYSSTDSIFFVRGKYEIK